VPITAVPPAVFSEAMRDIDLFVTASTVANDLLWLERMSGERRLAEYWDRIVLEGLATTVELRRHAIGELMAAGRRKGPFALGDRSLVVSGGLGTYEIDLATAKRPARSARTMAARQARSSVRRSW
jgi:hypothetical protein